MENLYCGRLDEHEPHEVSIPQPMGAGLPRRITYWCPGPPVIEGGNPAARRRALEDEAT